MPIGNNSKSKMKKLLEDALVLDRTMILFLVSRFLIHFGGSIPYIFLPTLMLQKKFTLSQGANVLSAAAFANTLSRFTICAITDHPRAPSGMSTTTISLFLSGSVMASVPFCNEYYMFVAAGMMYGFLSAPEASLLSVVLGEITSLENLNYLFGVVAFVQGVGTFGGPPTAGLLIDQFGNAKDGYGIMICYVCGGSFYIIAGIFCLYITCSNKSNNDK